MSKDVMEKTNGRLFVDASPDTLRDWMVKSLEKLECHTLAWFGFHPEDFATHSWRKSALTHIMGQSTGVTIVAVFKRACWALPSLMETYCNYDPVGDRTVGRAAAGLDSSSADFGILPPRFKADLEHGVWRELVPGYDEYPVWVYPFSCVSHGFTHFHMYLMGRPISYIIHGLTHNIYLSWVYPYTSIIN